MKNKVVMILVMTLVLIISCSKTNNKKCEIIKKDGYDLVKNSNYASKPNLKISLDKLHTISGNSEDSLAIWKKPFSYSVDQDGSIYILDLMASNIKKYNQKGEFLQAISRKGNGPGELNFPNTINIFKDTLIVTTAASQKTIKFKLDGTFISDYHFESSNPQMLDFIGNGKFAGYVNSFDQKSMTFSFNFGILSNKMKSIKVLKENKFSLKDAQKLDFLNILTPFKGNAQMIVLPINSDSKYNFSIYDTQGNIIKKVVKTFRKLEISKEEKADFNQMMREFTKGSGGQTPETKLKYKKAINNVLIDSADRIWISPSIDRNDSNRKSCIFDIFDKNGVFLNRVDLAGIKGMDFVNLSYNLQIFGDKLYVFDASENILEVYQINISGI